MRKLLAVIILSTAAGVVSAAETAPAESARYAKGTETLAKVTGANGAATVESLREFAPALGRWIVEFGYGDVVSRPQLDLRTRELATVAALTALGNAQPQLRAHLNGALNVGCKPEEIVEVIMQMAVYAGFPASLNGIAAAKEIFAQRGVTVSSAP